ncbi:CcoQ/FixQ family Cbb3-type cytochrome c oxidase assembly chaperone [Lutibacter aestuarii]|uniref:CcoQ/FixQ family Cbb3-type cytochrome c oxidase assembly chaperone n=1 Tax=Lutibacter aestuarii TaxID=861111 RepID=A0ABW2Z587_9FLAO|nr:CcoQ/FixQ family Cbb3-type cytochrome c oxidase assembly chaperone [uncultured Lutibacter sp.]
MLKFIKHNLASIDGVEIYPIISLVLFFVVFITMVVFVFKLPKRRIDEVSQMPLLDNDNNTKEITHE